MRRVPANDGMESDAAGLADYDVTDTQLLVRLTGFSAVP